MMLLMVRNIAIRLINHVIKSNTSFSLLDGNLPNTVLVLFHMRAHTPYV